MIRLENVSLAFRDRSLFSNADWQITEDSRIGLVGVNGSGKSTLLKVLSSQQEIDSGNVIRAKNFTVGYLPQELHTISEKTVFEEAAAGCGSARQLQLQLEEITEAMHQVSSETEEYLELVHEFGRLQRLFEEQDGFSVESKVARVLLGLAIPQEWWLQPMSSLSGGWQMRVHLARLILSAPSLLLLDEPTNHLDVESIVWLSAFLRNYEGGLIMISHDRYFLDENVREIVEIWNGELHFYAGNYSFYVQEKEKRLELLKSAFEHQREEISRIKQFIDRFRYQATKAKQVQSRVKMLEKIERIELPQDTDRIRLRLPEAPRSGRNVLEAKHLGHAFGEKHVFSNLNFVIERGEKVALVGVNGAGKTTLLKIMAGVLVPAAGSVTAGHNVSSAYYAQIVSEQMDLRHTVLAEISQADTNHDETQLRSILGTFLFTGDDAFKKVSVLSGGEKSRLALAKILLKPSNLLLLDEPTNHLDMASKEILMEALEQYNGTVVFIAHDRYFMDRLAQRVLELKDGVLTSYPGNYSEYIRKIQEAVPVTARPESKGPVVAYKNKEQKRLEAEQRAKFSKFRKDVILPLQNLEALIAEHEEQKKLLEGILADDQTYQNKSEFDEHLNRYRKVQKLLEEDYKKWEELQRKKEQVEALQGNLYN